MKAGYTNTTVSTPSPSGDEPFLYVDECLLCHESGLDWMWVGPKTLAATCSNCGRFGIRIPGGNRA